MRSLYVCLLVAMPHVFCFAGPACFAQQRNQAYDLWRVRSQTITEDLLKDGADLDPFYRALLWAGLAQRWWRDDPEKAKSWMARAIETVENVPNKENTDERRERLSTTRQLLQIVSPLDQKFSKRLIKILSDDAQQSGDAERLANAEGLFEAAISLVDIDPRRAAELGSLALRFGRSSNVAYLSIRLRAKDTKLADALLVQALVVARQTLDAELLMALTRAIFPAEMQLGTQVPLPPVNLRAELLQVDIGFVQANPINAENRNSVCAGIVSFILPVVMEFDRLLPQQAPAVRQAINQCQSLSPLSQQLIDDGLRPQPLNTVDDLLKAAEDSQDSKVRTVYQYRAAALAKEKKQYDRALTILDSMSKESRDFMGTSWESYRWDWASLSAIDLYSRGDLNGMRLAMEAVPTDLQAFAKLAFVDRLPERRNEDADPTFEFLNDARRGLRRSNRSEGEKYSWYFALLRLTVKYQPTEATAVLKEAIAALNRAEEAKAKNVLEKQSGNEDTSDIWKNLPVSLIEMDEYAVKEAISSITSPETRAQVRLALLGACLQRLSGSKQTGPNARPATSKGKSVLIEDRKSRIYDALLSEG